ncbi:MAG: hypothetical protein KA120_07525 [Candidatus Goldbacteria bacterium]|nr:hypothetical protein [Candidatus Goldiibacteriota bacterium]
MNFNFTSFPFIEKFLTYGGVFVSSVFTVILSSMLGREKACKKAGNVFFLISVIFTFFLDVFLFFYLKLPMECVAGTEIKRNYLFLLIVFLSYLMFTYNKPENGSDYVLLLINLICIQLMFLNSSFVPVFLFFAVLETSVANLTGIENEKKHFYLLISLIFLGLFLTGNKGQIREIGINGSIIFLLLFTFASTWTLNVMEVSNVQDKRNDNLLFLSLLTSFVAFFKFIEFCSSRSPVIYALFLTSFILLLFSVFNFLTEEDLQNFFISDFIKIFYLTLFSFSVLPLNTVDILAVFVLMLASAVFLLPFFSNIKKRHSVSYMRYNFDRIKGAGPVLISIILTLATEAYLTYKMAKQFTNFNPYVQTIILIAGFTYAINVLNKIFIVFSMVSRIKIDNLRDILFNKIMIKPGLFAGLVISLSLWWIKNG